jgi:prepilin-type N-terminal cleavage/methylation domain-containing protein
MYDAPVSFMKKYNGFTLIELSIAMVIIGLVVGGIVTGRELLEAARVRAQIKQFEQLFAAVNAFKEKYGGLPGDLDNNIARKVGLATNRDQGKIAPFYQYNNDGYITTYYAYSYNSLSGETLFFWQDLSATGLIPGTYGPVPVFLYNPSPGLTVNMTAGQAGQYLPTAALKNDLYVMAFSVTGDYACARPFCFALYPVPSTDGNAWVPNVQTGISAAQLYAMDTKMDDGLPRTGRIHGNTRTTTQPLVYVPSAGCLTGGNTRYDLTYTTPDCVINISYYGAR